MKAKFLFPLLVGLIAVSGCQKEVAKSKNASSVSGTTPVVAPIQISDQVVDTACGECQFDMDGDSCDLAIRVDGNSYFVDGSALDDHGDAHAADGLCNCIRKAKVTGEIKDGRFTATSFEVLPKKEGEVGADPDPDESDDE